MPPRPLVEGGKICRGGINCRGCRTVPIMKNRDFIEFFGMARGLLIHRWKIGRIRRQLSEIGHVVCSWRCRNRAGRRQFADIVGCVFVERVLAAIDRL
jgi:hypothetical protein